MGGGSQVTGLTLIAFLCGTVMHRARWLYTCTAKIAEMKRKPSIEFSSWSAISTCVIGAFSKAKATLSGLFSDHSKKRPAFIVLLKKMKK